ncbi:MAG: DUF4385 domain-containing protein [Bacteroidota bacterium]
MAVEYDVDFRARPECYEIGRGERGVFKVQPYKSELLPLWSFKTPEAARTSSAAIWAKFEAYREAGDFVGMDMARKYLQMGYTRAMRYAKYPGGRKYDADRNVREPLRWADAGKREAALIFDERLKAAKTDPAYQHLRAEHQARPRSGDC